jgi:hypothetical protein
LNNVTTTAEPAGTVEVAVNMSTALRWRGLIAVTLFGGGGLVLFAISAFGLTGQHPAQRIGGVVLSVVLVSFGGFALRGVLRPSVWVIVAADGLTMRGRPGEFQVPWSDLATVVLERERRSWGRSRYWFYRLLLTPRAVDDFVVDHPDMAARRGRDNHYIYDLGRIGRAGRRLDRALRAHAPTVFPGVRTR